MYQKSKNKESRVVQRKHDRHLVDGQLKLYTKPYDKVVGFGIECKVLTDILVTRLRTQRYHHLLTKQMLDSSSQNCLKDLSFYSSLSFSFLFTFYY